mgnify:CR=1 FL=1
MIAPKHNPFRAQQLDAIAYRPIGVTWEQIDARLAALRCRAAIRGPHGSGKTTLIDALHHRLAAQGLRIVRVHLQRDTPPPTRSELAALTATLGPGDVLMYDGADHLPMLRWRQLRRATREIASFIVTTHRRRLLPTLVRTRTTPALLRHLVAELLADRARSDIAARCDTLFTEHRGNLRDALRACYHLASSPRRQAAKR